MHTAFTMLELVFVIVVIGILAAAIIPNTKTNPVQEAAIQLISHIRYTQHLAMMDDKYNAADSNWYKGRWQIVFSTSDYTNNVPAYTIFSDASTYTGDVSESEVAKNPQNINQIMTGGYGNAASIDIRNNGFKGMEKLNLGLSYGITSVTLSAGCSGGSRISFDYMGRPLKGDHSTMSGPYAAGTQRLITSNCLITLTNETENAIITIRPETGYTSVTF
ncbi:MAG TPA: type II/IV secretion system protein [Sulfurimonas sp. UBA12504]|nr:MAG TPA: type II/IV secretion system protein [Sulfurimonas sp. UBA12504]